MKTKRKCPRCKKQYSGYSAISRKDNKTEICSDCGTAEALENFINYRQRRKLIRVVYGKKSTSEKDREYQINGRGHVGTIAEYKQHFPDEEFEIVERQRIAK